MEGRGLIECLSVWVFAVDWTGLGMRWVAFGCIRLHSIALYWTELHYVGWNCIGLAWIGLDWVGLSLHWISLVALGLVLGLIACIDCFIEIELVMDCYWIVVRVVLD